MSNSKTYDTSGMMYPVECNHCRRIYDLTKAEKTARYADCDVFTTPCCRRTADTRPWKGLADYTKLERGRAVVASWDVRGNRVNR